MMDNQPLILYVFCIMAEIIGVLVAICSCRFFIRWIVSAFSKTKKKAKPERGNDGQRNNEDQVEERSARTSNYLIELEMMQNRPTRSSDNYIERNRPVIAYNPRRQNPLRYEPSMPTIYENEEEHESSSEDHTRPAVMMPVDLVVVNLNRFVHVGRDEEEMKGSISHRMTSLI